MWEHLQFVKALYPQSDITLEAIIRQFNLQEHLYKIPGALSKGTLQKLMIALALLRQYDVFLADEPFTGLDPKQIHGFKQILQELRQRDKAILISTHLLDKAEGIWDRYIFLYDGKILAEFEGRIVIGGTLYAPDRGAIIMYVYKMLCLNSVENFNVRAYYGIILFLAFYSGYCCFIKIKPAITVKPASIFFLSENRLNKLMCISME